MVHLAPSKISSSSISHYDTGAATAWCENKFWRLRFQTFSFLKITTSPNFLNYFSPNSVSDFNRCSIYAKFQDFYTSFEFRQDLLCIYIWWKDGISLIL